MAALTTLATVMVDALPSSVPNHASALYARNVASLLEHVLTLSSPENGQAQQGPGAFALNREDPIVAGCLLTHAGRCWRPDVVGTATAEQALVGASN